MYSVWSARDRFGSYKSIWQKIPLFPWMGVGLLFHFPSLLVLLFAALSSLSYRKRDIGWDTCVSTLDSFSYFMCFTCLKPPWSYHLENEQLLITLWDGKKTQYHYSNQSNISSAQGLKMCDDPSETSLHPWHMHKVLFRAPSRYMHSGALSLSFTGAGHFSCAAHVLLPWGSSCVWYHRCSRWKPVLQQGVFLNAKHKLEA